MFCQAFVVQNIALQTIFFRIFTIFEQIFLTFLQAVYSWMRDCAQGKKREDEGIFFGVKRRRRRIHILSGFLLLFRGSFAEGGRGGTLKDGEEGKKVWTKRGKREEEKESNSLS